MKYLACFLGILCCLGMFACKPTKVKEKEKTEDRSIDTPPKTDVPPEPSNPTERISGEVSEDENLDHLTDEAQEYMELSKPNLVKCWVGGLRVKSQPNEDFPDVARLKEGETATYLYQRTVRKTKYKFEGQWFEDPWYLIRTKTDLVGWVHGGGIKFVEVNPVASKEGERGMDKRVAEVPVNPKIENDWIFVPGKRIGQIKLTTSEAMLVKLFGADKVKRGEVSTDAGKKEACTYVMKGEADELAITWKDATRTKVKAVYISNINAKWHSPEGVRMGQSLQELAKVNEAPISFYGFDWEYSGTISTWRNGIVGKYLKHFYLVLHYNESKSSKEFLSKMKGEKILHSNGQAAQNVAIYVKRIVLYLD